MADLNGLIRRYKAVVNASEAAAILQEFIPQLGKVESELAVTLMDTLIKRLPANWEKTPAFLASLLNLTGDLFPSMDSSATLPCIRLCRLFIAYGYDTNSDGSDLASLDFAHHVATSRDFPQRKANTMDLLIDPPMGFHSFIQQSNTGASGDANPNSAEDVRYAALHSLRKIFRTATQQVLFPLWPELLSEKRAVSQTGTLSSCVLKDPAPYGRFLGLSCLHNLIFGSKKFLAVAEDTESLAYTSYSQEVASRIRELHKTAILALSSEKNTVNILHVIRLLSYLVAQTPYTRLRPGLLHRCVKSLQPFANHADVNIRVGTLQTFQRVFVANCINIEVQQILHGSAMGTPAMSGLSTPSLGGGGAWLPDLALSFADINNGLQPTPVKVDALKLLVSILRHASPILTEERLAIVAKVAEDGMSATEQTLLWQYLKLFETVNRAARGRLIDFDEEGIQQKETALSEHQFQVLSEFWQRLLPRQLLRIVQHYPSLAVRCAAFDCLAAIGPQIYSDLPANLQVLCLTLVLGVASPDYEDVQLDNKDVHDVLHVRAAAIRAVGHLLSYPPLQNDAQFVQDSMSTSLAGLKPPNSTNVAAQAAWTLAAVCELYSVTDKPDRDYLLLFHGAIEATLLPEKARHNAVRALGTLLADSRAISLPPQDISAALAALGSALVIKQPKVRWNAAHACMRLLSHRALVLRLLQLSALSPLLTALSNSLLITTNYKSQLSAVAALSTLTERELFPGDTLPAVLGAAMYGFDTTAVRAMQDVNYQKDIMKSLRTLLSQLLIMACPSDVTNLRLNKIALLDIFTDADENQELDDALVRLSPQFNFLLMAIRGTVEEPSSPFKQTVGLSDD